MRRLSMSCAAVVLLLLATTTIAQSTDTTQPSPTTASPAPTGQSSATVPPATTNSPAPTLPRCDGRVLLDATVGQVLNGNLKASTVNVVCDTLQTFALPSGQSADGILQVNFAGDYLFTAPQTELARQFAVTVSCLSTPVCNLAIYASVAMPLTTVMPVTTTPAPTTAGPQNQECPPVYYFQVGSNKTLSASMRALAGQLPCPNGRSYDVQREPRYGRMTHYPIGDFRYDSPATTAAVTWDDFGFAMLCQGVTICLGTGYIQIADIVVPAPTPQPAGSAAPSGIPATNSPPTGPVNPVPFMTCTGTCNTDAWKAVASDPNSWDISPNNGAPPRFDNKALDSMDASWEDGSLVIRAYSKIGNVGVRFPTFETIENRVGDTFSDAELRSRIADSSVPFDISCLGPQSSVGFAENVWRWDSVVNRTGHVGTDYASGNSWYQKFGGKHINCDTFTANSCQYAPLLTPKSQQDATAGKWSVDINGCDVTWKGVFTFDALRSMKRRDGSPIFSLHDSNVLETTIMSQAVKPAHWVDPSKGFLSTTTTRNLVLDLEPFVANRVDAANQKLFSIDSEFFAYNDPTTGDRAFGLNILFYPQVDETMTTSYGPDRHVTGWRWVSQDWAHPDMTQCPTCVGTDTSCQLDEFASDSTFTMDDLFVGNCQNPRIAFSRGPSFTIKDCKEETRMHVFGRKGFSAPRFCRRSFQNLTLRGVAVGSALSNASAANFAFEGRIRLQLLLDNGMTPYVDIELSTVVGMATVDGQFTGTSDVCRAGPYWPVYDPLGTSVPDQPHRLAEVTDFSPLCIDREDRTFGPTGWALVTFDIKQVPFYRVTVEDLTMSYPTSPIIHFKRADPNTGAPTTVLPDGNHVWWTRDYPFLNFRDLSTRLPNSSFTFADDIRPIVDQDYAFAFTPGTIGITTQVTIRAVLRIQQSDGSIARVTFTRMLATDNMLTALSRFGPPVVAANVVVAEPKSSVLALAATGSLLAGLLLVGIVAAVSDTHVPLPKWMPKGLKIPLVTRSSRKPGTVSKRATVRGLPVQSP